MPVAFLRFEWESVANSGSGGYWHHSEYLIAIRASVTGAGDDLGGGNTSRYGDDGLPVRREWTIRRRYTDFLHCHEAILSSGVPASAVPALPPKEPVLQRLFGSFAVRLDWQECRRRGLQAYAGELLLTPELQALPCVRQLLAPLAATTPEPPACVRVRALDYGTRGRGPELPARRWTDGSAPPSRRTTRALQVHVQQATTGTAVNSTDGDPTVEVVVAFCEVSPEGAPHCAEVSFSGRELAARLRLPVSSSLIPVCATVQLDVRKTYAVEAMSVSAFGLQSPPLTLMAFVPGFDDDQSQDDCDLLAQQGPEETSVGDDYSPEETPECEDLVGLVDEDLSESDDEAPPSFNKPQDFVLSFTKFTGSAAAEYVAVAAKQVRSSLERTPCRWIETGPDGSSSRSTCARQSVPALSLRPKGDALGSPGCSGRRLVQLDLDPMTKQLSSRDPERRLHRDSGVLDIERSEVELREQDGETRRAYNWVVTITGRAQLLMMAGVDIEDPNVDARAVLRELLLSGEVLCELANAVAAKTATSEDAGGEDGDNHCSGAADAKRTRQRGGRAGKRLDPPVPSYNKGALSRFKQMENISLFLAACRTHFKVPEHQLFCTTDLSNGTNMHTVVKCLLALELREQGPNLSRAATPRGSVAASREARGFVARGGSQ